MHVQHTNVSVRCPVCGSARIIIDEQSRTAWTLYDLTLRCEQCDATCTAHYACYAVEGVTYGDPIGPVYLTDDPQQALAAWDVDEAQWIRTDGTRYAVGYEPTVLGGRGSADGWRDSSPEDLEALHAA